MKSIPESFLVPGTSGRFPKDVHKKRPLRKDFDVRRERKILKIAKGMWRPKAFRLGTGLFPG
jgi:hypothetical protein